MKTLYKYIFVSVAMLIALTGCDDKHVKMPATGGLDNAEQLVEGTYNGTWTKTNLTTEEVETTAGSITFSWNEELGNNVTNITPTTETPNFLNLKSETSACNISRLSSGLLSYWNVYSLNPFGTTFTGKVSPEGVCTMDYIMTVVIKRKETQFQYSFTGNKQ